VSILRTTGDQHRALARCSQRRDSENRLNGFSFRCPVITGAEARVLTSRRPLGRFQPGAQNFGNAPGLCDAAAGHVRLARVKHFADRTDAVIT